MTGEFVVIEADAVPYIKVTRHLPGGTEENLDRWYPGRDSNRIYLENKSTALETN
jgi:hypothetical protein